MNKRLPVREVHKIVENTVKTMEEVKCQNSSYVCSLPTEDGRSFCLKHILQDPTAPFKQCSFIHGNGKQCLQARLAEDRNDSSYSTYCVEHSRSSQINKTKSTVGSFKDIASTETLINSLKHHVKIDKIKPQSTTKITPFDEEEEVDVVTADPFTDINASDINNRGKNILDFASESSSDEDMPTLANTWRSHELDASDDESVDSDEDVLKHAGIYTVDEVVTISNEKMQRLQNLYIDQFQRLQYVLREKRRQYLHEIKKEKETLSSIHHQAKDSPKERRLYNNLKAMNHYHKRFGTEALLHRQFIEKRQKLFEPTLMAAPILPQQKNIPKCSFSEGGVKCNERSIPCCRFCRKHIMEDKKQILFKTCAVEKSGIVCQEPVVTIFEDNSCILHTAMPQPKVYKVRKYESETDEEMDVSLAIKKEEPLDIEMDTTTTNATDDCIVIYDENEDLEVESKIDAINSDEVVVT